MRRAMDDYDCQQARITGPVASGGDIQKGITMPGTEPCGSRASSNADLNALAALLVVTAALGPKFTVISINGATLPVLELGLLGVGLLALRRLGLRRLVGVLRERTPMIGFALFWGAGLIAFVRGALDVGLTDVIYDVRIFIYASIVPLVLVVADSRERLRRLLTALLYAGIAGTVTFGLSLLIARVADAQPLLADQEGESAMAGMYAGLVALLIAASMAAGRKPTPYQALAVLASLTVVALTDKRAAWLAILAALFVVVLLARGLRRAAVAGGCLLAITLAAGSAYAIERALGPLPSSASEASPNLIPYPGAEAGLLRWGWVGNAKSTQSGPATNWSFEGERSFHARFRGRPRGELGYVLHPTDGSHIGIAAEPGSSFTATAELTSWKSPLAAWSFGSCTTQM